MINVINGEEPGKVLMCRGKSLTIGQLNCQTPSDLSFKEGISLLCSHFNTPIVCIQEHHFVHEDGSPERTI